MSRSGWPRNTRQRASTLYTSWWQRRTQRYKVYSHGGIFDWIRHDLWNQRRSQLTHTEFGNSILAIWSDSSRWEPVIDSIYRDDCHWALASREVWEESFRQWTEVKHELLAHSCRINQEFQLFRSGDALLLSDQSRIGYSVMVTRRLLAQTGRYDDWINDVERQVGQVERAVQQLGPLAVPVGAPLGRLPFTEEKARARLVALTEAGKLLKLVYSGRKYFNHGDSD